MIDVLNDIEILEKSLDLDDFGRQLLIWEMIQKKKKEVADFEAEMCPNWIRTCGVRFNNV